MRGQSHLLRVNHLRDSDRASLSQLYGFLFWTSALPRGFRRGVSISWLRHPCTGTFCLFFYVVVCLTVQGLLSSSSSFYKSSQCRRLRLTWKDALDGAEATFRQLLTSYSSSEWKHISLTSDSSPSKGKSRASTNPELTDVVVHRKTTKSGENVYRVVLDVPITDQSAPLDAWKAVITTPELRQEWDPAVESAQLVEMFDRQTRISKTNFTLGWPAKFVILSFSPGVVLIIMQSTGRCTDFAHLPGYIYDNRYFYIITTLIR